MLALALSGSAVVYSLGLRSWPLLPVGYLAGVAQFTLISYLLIAIGAYLSPLLPLAINVLGSLGYAYFYLSRKGLSLFQVIIRSYQFIVASAALIAASVAAISTVNLTKYTFDTANYLLTGNLISRADFEFMSPSVLISWFSPVSVMHSAANLWSDYYLIALSPLLGLSLLASFFWLVKLWLAKKSDNSKLTLFALLGVLVLATNHGFIWNALYLNSHILVAASVLLMAVSGWFLATKTENQQSRLFLYLLYVFTAMTIITRSEGIFLATLVALPIFFSKTIIRKYQLGLGLAIASSFLLQQGSIYLLSLRQNIDLPDPNMRMVYLSVALFITAISLFMVDRYIPKKKLYSLLPLGVMGSLLAALGLFTLNDPTIMKKSLKATYSNLVTHPETWGSIFLISAIATIVLLAAKRLKLQRHFLYPLVGFLPLGLLLAYLRDGAYRDNPADSFNRMLMHILPMAVFFMMVLLFSRERSWLATKYLNAKKRNK